jgi:hypothetical protein
MGHMSLKIRESSGHRKPRVLKPFPRMGFWLAPFSANKTGSPDTRVLLTNNPRLALLAGAPPLL